MAQNAHVCRRLGLAPKDQQRLLGKAGELQRVAQAKLGVGGLGQVGAGCRRLPLAVACARLDRPDTASERGTHPPHRLDRPPMQASEAHTLARPPPRPTQASEPDTLARPPARPQGELCAGAACVELAAQVLGLSVDAALIIKCSAVKEGVYRNTKAALQKVLGLAGRATARELCVQFGCARHDQAVRACLAAYKERFVRSLPPAQQGHVDFARPAFLAAAFYLVARKNKVAVSDLQ